MFLDAGYKSSIASRFHSSVAVRVVGVHVMDENCENADVRCLNPNLREILLNAVAFRRYSAGMGASMIE